MTAQTMAQLRLGGEARNLHCSGSGGEPLSKRRLTTVVEYYSIASLSKTVMAFHDTFNTGNTPAERTHFLRDCVNQGWPAASAFKLALSIATHLLTVASVKPAAVQVLTTAQMKSATVTKNDIQPSHLWLDATGTFQECVLMAQVTPKTARVLLQDITEVVSCRQLWPWIPKMHGHSVSNGGGDASTMTAAELLYAFMCEPRGSNSDIC